MAVPAGLCMKYSELSIVRTVAPLGDRSAKGQIIEVRAGSETSAIEEAIALLGTLLFRTDREKKAWKLLFA